MLLQCWITNYDSDGADNSGGDDGNSCGSALLLFQPVQQQSETKPQLVHSIYIYILIE